MRAEKVLDIRAEVRYNRILPVGKVIVEEKKKGKGGRPKGSCSNQTAVLRTAIIKAAEYVGNEDFPEIQNEIGDGLTAYLISAARDNPAGFLRLLGQVLPHIKTDNSGMVYNLHLDFSSPAIGAIQHEETNNDR